MSAGAGALVAMVLLYVIGYIVGRLGERRAITEWLWNRPAGGPRACDILDVEQGRHREW